MRYTIRAVDRCYLYNIARMRRVDHIAAADVDTHMADTAAVGEEYKVSRLEVFTAYISTCASLSRCNSRYRDTVCAAYILYKSAAVET